MLKEELVPVVFFFTFQYSSNYIFTSSPFLAVLFVSCHQLLFIGLKQVLHFKMSQRKGTRVLQQSQVQCTLAGGML